MQASSFWASGRLEPAFFQISGFGRVFMYIQDPKLLAVFISDVRASGFQVSGGLVSSIAKL